MTAAAAYARGFLAGIALSCRVQRKLSTVLAMAPASHRRAPQPPAGPGAHDDNPQNADNDRRAK